MNSKMLVLVVAALLVLAGITLMAVAESTEDTEDEHSLHTVDANGDTRPYFWFGVVLVVFGCITVLIYVSKF